MKPILSLTKALADETRLRALMLLVGGELCLCQLIDVLALSPSTISKHMTILYDAGLIDRRKQGRWHYYRLAGPEAPRLVRDALDWVMPHLRGLSTARRDAKKLCCTRKKDPQELTACYSGK